MVNFAVSREPRVVKRVALGIESHFVMGVGDTLRSGVAFENSVVPDAVSMTHGDRSALRSTRRNQARTVAERNVRLLALRDLLIHGNPDCL